jgi:hypothetical protein
MSTAAEKDFRSRKPFFAVITAAKRVKSP